MRRGDRGRHDERSCERKKRYRGMHEAKRAVRQMQKWGKGHCEQLGVYLCGACGMYHAGRLPERKR